MNPQRRWTSFFDPEVIQRGRVVLRNDCVIDVTGMAGTTWRAQVRGSKNERYTTVVVCKGLRIDPARGLLLDQFEGSCSCPVGLRCKHMAAVMLRIEGPVHGDDQGDDADGEDEADQLPAEPEGLDQTWARAVDDPAAERWLGLLAAGTSSTQVDPGNFLVFRVVPGRRAPYALVVSIGKQRRDGSIGVQRDLSDLNALAGKVAHGEVPKYIVPADIPVILAIGAYRTDASYAQLGLELTGGQGAALLERAVATGRCHWSPKDGDGCALRRSHAQARLHWAHKEAGWRLGAVDEDGVELLLLPTAPPWWIDPATGEAGPLELDVPPAVRDAIVSMPWLPAAGVQAAWDGLRPWHDRLPPPPPEASAAMGVPVPHLRLWSTKVVVDDRTNAGWGVEAELARHWFRYQTAHGHVEVRPNSPGLRVAVPGGEPLVRDRGAEQRLTGRLEAMGLTAADRCLRYTGAGFRTSADAAHTWLALPTDAAHPDRLGIPPAVLAALAADGWHVHGGEAGQVEILHGGAWTADISESDEGKAKGWFDLSLGVEVDGRRIDLLPVVRRMLERGERALDEFPSADGGTRILLPVGDRTLVSVPREACTALHRAILDLHDAPVVDGKLRIAGDLATVAALEQLDPRWQGGERLRDLAKALVASQGIPDEPAPKGLTASLRPYQLHGFRWLRFLAGNGLGGVLADDMGLGKTVQALAFLVGEHEAGRLKPAALVVAPTSLLPTWRREAERFAPGLRVVVHHGAERGADLGRVAKGCDVLVTSYGIVQRDETAFAKVRFPLVICDEAQNLRNADAKTTRAVSAIPAPVRICLSGTPLENHLGELWSLMHIAVPGVLGTRSQFERAFRAPIERGADRSRQESLRRRVAPFILRRTKEAVATELPPKTEIVRRITLGDEQRQLYEAIRLSMDRKVKQAITAKGLNRSRLEFLEALLRLRQSCCDPRLVPSAKAEDRLVHAGSAKLEALMELVEELAGEGRRMLVFSQFTGMLDLIAEALRRAQIRFERLDGSTVDRAGPVDRFQRGEAPVFLISLKAGGTGLTLTAADTVIHYDPWWNPAAERQATDRAHRIGQDKPVFVYKLVAEGTVEDRILDLQERKRALADAIFDESGQSAVSFAESDMAELLKPIA